MAVFHSRVGTLVVLSNENRTAQRNHPTQEFNNGVVLSAEPLRDNQLFEVKIDRKVIFTVSNFCRFWLQLSLSVRKNYKFPIPPLIEIELSDSLSHSLTE